MKLRRVIIVGMGLIGSSIGRDLIRRRLAREVIGVGRSRANLRTALREKVAHRVVVMRQPMDLPRLIDDETDLVILATPVSTIRDYLKVLGRCRRGDRPVAPPLIMDVGSSKGTILREASRWGINFVAAHPIAGTEKSGVAGGESGLFVGHKCLLVPVRKTSHRSLAIAKRFWKALGSEVITLNPSAHDRILGAVSHLPHAVAYSLVVAIARLISVTNETRFALGGLRDTVRIAASPPAMWTDIFLENKRSVTRALRFYLKELTRLARFIGSGNRPALQRYLQKAQAIRLQIP